jgi:CBS domain-containing membrane protein
MHRLQVADIMSTELVTLEEDETLQLAETVMRHGRIRHLPVISEGRLVGLVTHRDLLRTQVSSLADLSPEERADIKLSIQVREIMSTEVKTVPPDMPVLEAAKIIKSNKYGCLPVTEKGRLVGIITEADFIDLVIRALS